LCSKKNDRRASIFEGLPYLLLLLFGTTIGVPFLHKFFSEKLSDHSQIILIYAIGFGLCAILLIIGFVAAITGLT